MTFSLLLQHLWVRAALAAVVLGIGCGFMFWQQLRSALGLRGAQVVVTSPLTETALATTATPAVTVPELTLQEDRQYLELRTRMSTLETSLASVHQPLRQKLTLLRPRQISSIRYLVWVQRLPRKY